MPICPECGAIVGDDDMQCPECGLNLSAEVEDIEEEYETESVVEFYVAADRLEAERIKAILEDHDIDTTLNVLENTSFPAGDEEIRVVVSLDDLDEAREIIEEYLDNEILSDEGYFIEDNDELIGSDDEYLPED